MKNILIVGGSSGIGKSLVEQLVKEEFNVVVMSRNITEITGAHHLIGDANDPDLEITLPFEELHGVVYCPGSIRLKPFKNLKYEDFLSDWQTNFSGAVNVLQKTLPQLLKTSGASVVLFSTVAVRTGMPFHASISAAKGAIEGLTRSLAAEFAPSIRFNAIAPSLTDTPLATVLLNNEVKRKNSADRHPMKTIGNPEDIASMAAYLLSERATFITGQVFTLDGGLSALRTNS